MLQPADQFHGSDLETVEKIYGIRREDIRPFGSNVNPIGLSPKMKEALQNNIINADKIVTFCGSTIADRMRKAGKQGKLYREQPFVMGVPGSMVFPETESEETIIVQGIIDVFFEEEDALVLLDYKTDRLLTGEENKLVKRYRAQMECYKMAMEKAYNKPVKEIILYSFALDKPVNVG